MKQWTIRETDKKTVSKLMLGCGVSSLTAAVLAQRGYSSPESVMQRLNVSELSSPFEIKDMQTAADTINEAIDSGERICVYGDYDCDGIMATVILYSYLIETGADVFYYIPERSEGYGLNCAAIDKIAEEGASLIVTVDNGIAAVSEAEYTYSKGMRLVITDHHQQGEQLPRAEAIVDPHRHDCFSKFKAMCGAGLALKLTAALDGGDYTLALEQFGDLAAIATVADVVSLTGENRFLVSYGLERINNTDRPSLMALISASGLDGKTIDSRKIGFGLAPRINAAGRYGSPRLAAELFLCDDPEECERLAAEIDSLNTTRRSAENDIITSIYSMIDSDPSLIRRRVIFLCGKGWHHGIIGIVAARILEHFGKPVFLASEENGEIRGSARSFGDFSVFGALSYAADALDKFGGHPAAGGFSIKTGQTEKFASLLEEYALSTNKNMPILSEAADAPLAPADITVQNVAGLNVLEPFGQDNEKPVFHIENAEITDITPLSGGLHTKLRFRLSGGMFEALLFRTPPESLCVGIGGFCDMLVTLGINEFKGKTSVSIIVSDIHPHGFEQNKFFAAKASFEALMRNEELPKNYYPNMLPSRDDAIKIYRLIPPSGINTDLLYLKLSDTKLNYCKFRAALEALSQLELISVSSADSTAKRLQVTKKADLDSAPVLAAIRSKF